MFSDTPAERQLTKLNQEIEQLEADTLQLESERAARSREARRASWRIGYFRLARALRAPAATFNLWPRAVMFLGPLVVGVMLLVVVNLATNSYPLAFFLFI